MSGRILFTYFIFISDNNLSLLRKKAYMGNPTLQILHSENKFWNENSSLPTSLKQFFVLKFVQVLITWYLTLSLPSSLPLTSKIVWR